MTPTPANLRSMAGDPAKFRAELRIDADGQSVRLGSKLDPWQRTDFEHLDPGWQRVLGRGGDGLLRGYLERPRGHSKTADIATMTTWALAMSPRTLSGVVCAADREQAGLLRSAIERLCRLNPWLRQVLDVQASRVVNRSTNSELQIISSDVATSWGLLPDFVVVDELANWPAAGEGLWQSLFSSAGKRANCLLCVISNAGTGEGESWQWRVMDAARTDPSWYFSRQPGPVASWITTDRLEEQRRLLPAAVYDRLWGNVWSSGQGDALRSDDIDQSFARGLRQLDSAERKWTYVGGLDIGISRDFSAFVVVGRDRHQRYRVARVQAWRPPQGGKIDLEHVEEAIIEASSAFRLRRVSADPYQAEYLLSRLKKRGVKCEPRNQTGKYLVEQCMHLLEMFTSGNIDCCSDYRLEHDLRHLRVEERSYGLRLVSDRTSTGHGDVATAMSIAMATMKQVKSRRLYVGGLTITADKSRGTLTTGHRAGPLSEVVKTELEKLSIQQLERMGYRKEKAYQDDAKPAGPWDPRWM